MGFSLNSMEGVEQAFFRCGRCHAEIYHGEGYYRLGERCFCRECLPKVAELVLLPYYHVAGNGGRRP